MKRTLTGFWSGSHQSTPCGRKLRDPVRGAGGATTREASSALGHLGGAIAHALAIVGLGFLVSGCGVGVVAGALVAVLASGGDGDDPAPLRAPQVSPVTWKCGEHHEVSMSPQGGKPPYEYSLEDAGTPGWLGFREESGTLKITGAPYANALGKYEILCKAQDEGGQQVTWKVILFVTPRLELSGLLATRQVASHWPIGAAGTEFDGFELQPGGGYEGPQGPSYILALEPAGPQRSVPGGISLSRDTDGKWRLWGTPIPEGGELAEFQIRVRDLAFAQAFPGCPGDAIEDLFPKGSHGQPEAAQLWILPPVSIETESIPTAGSSGPYKATLGVRGGSGTYNWTVVVCPEGLDLVPKTGDPASVDIKGTPTAREGMLRVKTTDEVTASASVRSFPLRSWVAETVVSGGEAGRVLLGKDGTTWLVYTVDSAVRLARQPPGGAWLTEAVPAEGNDARDPSLALDEDGVVWVSYTDGGNLVAAHKREDGSWSLDSLSVVDSGSATSLAAGPDGSVWLSYIDGGAVFVAHRPRGGSWVQEHIDDEGMHTSIAVAPEGTVWAGYSSVEKVVVLKRAAGGSWAVDYSDEPYNSAAPISIAVGHDGTVWVSYQEYTFLKVASLPPGGAWTSVRAAGGPQDIYEETLTGQRNAIVVASDGTTWAACSHSSHGRADQLWISSLRPGGSFESEVLVPTWTVTGRVSVAAGRNGEICVAYRSENDAGAELKTARLTAPQRWIVETPIKAKAGIDVDGSSLVVSPDGTVWTSYHVVEDKDEFWDWTEAARRLPDGIWASWKLADHGSYSSIAAGEAGTAWACYTAWRSGQGVILNASSLPPGAAVPDALGGGSYDSSIAVGRDGGIWISWATGSDVHVAHKAAGQETWVSEDVATGRFSSIAVSKDNTVWLSYADGLELKVARRLQGGSWLQEQVAVVADEGMFHSLAVAPDGTPWTSYTEGGKLKVARRLVGGSWAPETVTTEGGTAKYTSVSVATDGEVWVKYYNYSEDDWNYALCVARRTKPGSWEIEVVEKAWDSQWGFGGDDHSISIARDGGVWLGYTPRGDLKVARRPQRPCMGIGHDSDENGTSHDIPGVMAGRRASCAVPIFLSLDHRGARRVRFGITWDPETVRVKDWSIAGCPTLERLHGGTGPTEEEYSAAEAGQGAMNFFIDLSSAPPGEGFAPYFEEPICYLYIEGASETKGRSCALAITGTGSNQDPQIDTASGETLRPFVNGGILRLR